MSEAIAVALVGGLSVGIPTVIATVVSNNKSKAVSELKIEELTREVREHNNFAKRMPVVEEKIDSIDRRVSNLEKGAK